VFISPRQEPPPSLRWKGNQIRIELAEWFRADQTYIVSVSTAVTDLRRNRLDSAVTIAFSTGQAIDTGLVAGRVVSGDSRAAAGWTVGLYPRGRFDEYRMSDSLYPEYVTTTGMDGQFSLPYLPPGGYSLVAFEDKNRDELFNPVVEPFALPDRDLMIGGALLLDGLLLSGTVFDSLQPEVISVVTTKDRLLQVRLSTSIDPVYLARHPEELFLQTYPDSGSPSHFYCKGVFESRHDETSTLTACIPDLPEGVYRFSLKYDAGRGALVRDSVLVRYQSDNVPPQIAEASPGEKPQFVEQVEIGLTFSEPIARERLTEDTFVLWDEETVVRVERLWADAFHLSLEPERLMVGRKYRLDVTEFDIHDPIGNVLGDSLRSYAFSTLDEDSIGSVSGRVLVDLPHRVGETAVLTFAGTSSRSSYEVQVPGRPGVSAGSDRREFNLSVPPGKYLVSGFLDNNGDGKHTPGSINPFRLSETRALFSDTVAVRARFETVAVEFVFE